MTDFKTWDRATLEQFAREARDKLVEMAQAEPVAVIRNFGDPDWGTSGKQIDKWVDLPSGTKLYAAAPKHTPNKEQA